MELAKFYYIKPRFDNMFEDGTFKVVVLKGAKLNEYIRIHGENHEVDNKKEYRIPITASDSNSVFVQGLGYIKTKRIETIPVYDGTVDSWNDYVLKYGYQCLFYSMTGYTLNTMDCCAYNMQREFRSFILSGMGLVKYAKFVNLFHKINASQLVTLKSYPLIFNFEYDKYYFTPCYSLLGLLAVTPYVDTVADDDKMECLYRRIRTTELRDKGINKATEILDIIETEIKDGIFPVCPKERMRLLFGEDCVKAYTSILEDFKD